MAAKAEEIVIIGAGPAGIAAAIQLRRQGHDPVVFEMDQPGGLLRNAGWVENYPGFPDGISGADIINLFRKQLKRWRVNIVPEEVVSASRNDSMFVVSTKDNTLLARIVVIATGTGPITMSGIGPGGEAGDRILYEIHSISHVKGKKIVIIGAGDAAFDYALNLSRQNEVTILNRTDAIKCLPLLWERAQKVPSITYRRNTTVRLPVESAGKSLNLQCVSSGNSFDLAADYLILAIGRQPRLEFLSPELTGKIARTERVGELLRYRRCRQRRFQADRHCGWRRNKGCHAD